MILRGKTTIELTNVETGEVRTVEEENMITNGLQKILQPLPTESDSPMTKCLYNSADTANGAYGLERTMKMLTGGIMLLDTTLDEDVNNFVPKAGITTVGCGTHVPYTGSNIRAGSYNDKESGEIENGYKHVWDFSTSHGNGEIACVCLTTREGGYTAGGTYPYDSSYVFATLGSTTSRPTYVDDLGNRSGYKMYTVDNNGNPPLVNPLYVDYNKGEMICLSDFSVLSAGTNYVDPTSSTPIGNSFFGKSFLYKKEITLSRKRIILKDFSIFDKNRVTSNTNKGEVPSLGYGTRVFEDITVQMPGTLKAVIDDYSTTKGYFHTSFSSDEGFLYFVIYKNMASSSASTGIQIDDTFHIWKINMDNFTSSHIVVTNTTGKVLLAQTSSFYAYLNQIFVTNDYAFVVSITDGYAYQINLNDSTDVSQLHYQGGDEFVFSSHSDDSITYRLGFVINKKFYFIKDGRPVVYDIVKKEVLARHELAALYYEGRTRNTGVYRYALYAQHSDGIILVYYRDSASSWARSCLIGFMLPELYLTINNLSSPVLKTSAETMKITYTLTMSES